ncbi:MAG: polyphosphate glucokinase [Desulfuromonas sp.]|uniref:polyphosphate--glucose phosphotransferase n=1 Tax=Desulfuromonas sp. TaxID=892 RepID=UPI000CC04E64|nr:ROK family protein [Desulfuromonas sp.]PLX82827.1 MAG: polyphosphate glucokinase [Desulfuromonas sp.]
MHVLGIDIGGSGIKGALVDVTRGELVSERVRIPTPAPSTPRAVAKAVRDLAGRFSLQGPIGCGFPAVIRDGIALTAANIDSAWIGNNVAAALSAATGCPCRVLNDADAAGIAEMRFGAGRGEVGVVMVVTVGTGLGSALFSGGVLFPNTEFGHFPMKGGAAEKYASAGVREEEELSWEKWGRRLGRFLGKMEDLLWPDLFIIGGGVSRKHDRFFPAFKVRARVVPAQQRNQAGIIGAACHAAEALEVKGEKRGKVDD